MTAATRFAPDEARVYTRACSIASRATSTSTGSSRRPTTAPSLPTGSRSTRVLRGGGHRDRPAQLQRRRRAGHSARGHRQRGDGPALLDRRRRGRPARPAARPRYPLARRRGGERREREAARRVSPQHGLPAVLAAVHAVADGRGENVPRPPSRPRSLSSPPAASSTRTCGSSRRRRWTATSR